MSAPISTGRVVAVVIVTVLLFGGGSVAANVFLLRSMCSVIAAQVEVYRETPPTTPTGVKLAEQWEHAYRWPCRE